MKGGSYLLDSGIVIDLFKGNEVIISRIEQVETIYISVIGLGELYYGANKSTKPEKHFLEVENLRKKVPILDCSAKTAKIYGHIKNELRKIGQPIPENDIWIAAIAIENNLILANRDKHFDKIEELRQEKWG